MRKGKGELLKLYMKSFIAGDSIRKSVLICDLSIPTSFKWRHRILASLQNQQSKIVLDGIVESDDVFLPYSQKGKRNIDRKPRKRRNGMFDSKKRGVSDENLPLLLAKIVKTKSIYRLPQEAGLASKI